MCKHISKPLKFASSNINAWMTPSGQIHKKHGFLRHSFLCCWGSFTKLSLDHSEKCSYKIISDIAGLVIFYGFIYECIKKMLFAKWQNSFTQTLTNIYLTNEIARPIRRTFSEWEMPRFNELYLISKMYRYNHTRTNEIISLTRYLTLIWGLISAYI